MRFLEETVGSHRRKQFPVILDNLAVHKTPLMQAWLEHHSHVQLHFTPTYASWLNPVEIWLGMVTCDCIRRGIFPSVPDLLHKIMSYVRPL
ncbi:MAG: transposase [Acidobacteria bacterium]|nr:transposase [Acidobacteriota bacterium]